MSILQQLLRFLRCPEDHGALRLLSGRVQCTECVREYAAEDNFVSLVTQEPAALGLESPYARTYHAAREEASTVRGWRLSDSGVPDYKRRQVHEVRQLLTDAGPGDLVCDFSAGPGYYTFAYARHWRWLIHCDLCLDSLTEARKQAQQDGIGNVLFVRMDYFRPPFRGTLPLIICMDTLIRGPQHELALLRSIQHSLSSDGKAVVDFHNWWHNPIRRLGLLPDNFVNNRSYRAHELAPLLWQAGIENYERFGFHQEAEPGTFLASLLRKTLPPTRWMYRFGYAAPTHSRPA